MKKYVFGILLGMMIILTGCLEEEDGYSLDKMWVSFGVLEETGTNPLELRIILDNDDILIPVAAEHYRPWYYDWSSGSQQRLNNGDRILVNFTILGDDAQNSNDPTEYYVKINSIKKILKKGVIEITPEMEDSIGNDPIDVKEMWVTDSLLNFKFRYWGGYMVHLINLVREPGDLTAADQPIELELRHNNHDDAGGIPFEGFVSFSLKSLQLATQDSVRFRVTGTDYDNEEFEYEGVYHYGEND